MKSQAVTRILKAALITISLTVALVTAAFYSLPTVLTKILPTLIERNIGRKTSVAAVEWDVMPFTVSMRNFVIHEKNGQDFVAFDKLSAQIDLAQSFKQAALVINGALLQKPIIHLARHKDGRFNFQDLSLSETTPKTQGNSEFPVNVGKLSVTEGKLVWNDGVATRPWSETVEPLQLVVEDFNVHSGKPARIQLDFVLQSGGHVAWSGTLGLNPLASQGKLKLDHLNLSNFINSFLPDAGLTHISATNALDADYQVVYAKDKFTLNIPKAAFDLHDVEYAQAGRTIKLAGLKHETEIMFAQAGHDWQLEAKTAKTSIDGLRVQDKLLGQLKQLAWEAPYRASYHGNHLDLSIHDGSLEGKGFRLSDQEKNLAFFPALALQGVQANLDKHILNAKSVSLNNANIDVWLNADGTINYQSLVPAKDTAIPANVSASGPDWQISVENIALNDCAVNFEDRTFPKPTTLKIKPINLKLDGYSNRPATRWPFELTAGINENGWVSLKGNTSAAPFAAIVNIDVKNIELEKFQPYYDQVIRLDIIDGMLNVNGDLSLQQNPTGALDMQFNGGGTISDLLIRDQRVHKDFLKWEGLTLKNLAVDLLKQRYTATELVINKPYARVTIRKDKTVNFSNLLITKENTARTAPIQKPADAKPPYFKLGKIQIIDGSSDFTDLSLVLPFSAHIKSLDGGASGASSDKNSQIKVSLKGNAYDLAPVDIIGTISPYLGEYHTKINFNGLPMPLVSSYMVQFAGYKVEKGKMTLNLDYQIADKKLTASNHFLIDQFELGERIQHPDAVSLPMKLAVALLKDSNGKIKIDVPVSGDLDNPTFNIGAIITDALINSISKIISSPFSALASLAGGGETDLSVINFKAGSAVLDHGQQIKLDGIATALQARPQLTLEIKGTTLEVQDWPAISDDALYDQLKIRRATEINQHATRKIRAEYIELSNEDYRRLLADMFIEKFPLLAKRSWLGEPQLDNPQAGQEFYAVAKQKLQDVIKPEQERLKELANDRAQAIAKYLVQQGRVAQERVYILDSVVNPDKNTKEINSLLALKAN